MHQIRYFVALCDTLNFTQAAERCNVSQPSLTRAIQALEAELGGALLRRERHLSHLTELGDRMLPLMRQCYDTALAAKSLAHEVKRGDTAPLGVAVSHTLDAARFMPAFRELARGFPGLSLTLRRGSAPDIAELLKAGKVELAIAGPLDETWERLDIYPLFDEPMELVVGVDHRLSGVTAVAFEDVVAERFLFLMDCEMASALSDALRARGVVDPAAHRVANASDLLAMLEANLGVAILPASLAGSTRLRRVPLDGLDLVRRVSVYTVAGRPRSPVGATLRNLLRSGDWFPTATVVAARGASR